MKRWHAGIRDVKRSIWCSARVRCTGDRASSTVMTHEIEIGAQSAFHRLGDDNVAETRETWTDGMISSPEDQLWQSGISGFSLLLPLVQLSHLFCLFHQPFRR